MAETALHAIAPADERDPWEQLDGEPDHCYAAFLAYRDHPTRKIRHVAQGLHGSALPSLNERTLYGWREQYQWETRAKAWTQLMQRQADTARLQAVADMNRRHVEAGALMVQLGTKRIQQAMDDPEDLSKVPVPAAGQMVESGQRVQRAAMGIQDTHTTTGQRQGIIIQINLPGQDKPTVIEGIQTETEDNHEQQAD